MLVESKLGGFGYNLGWYNYFIEREDVIGGWIVVLSVSSMDSLGWNVKRGG